MRRNIIISILLLISLVLITGCIDENKNKEKNNTTTNNNETSDITSTIDEYVGEEKKEIVFEDTNRGYKTTFIYYDKDFAVVGPGTDNNLEVESLMYGINLKYSYTYYDDAKTFNTIKTKDSKNNIYKEYKWGKYKGYITGTKEDMISIKIPLEKTKNSDLILEIKVTPMNEKIKNVVDVCNNKVVQSFLNSIVFEKNK